MDSTKCSSQSVSEEVTHSKNIRGQQSFGIKQSNDASLPKNPLHDVREKLALVQEYSKQICKSSKSPKKKKGKNKKQINIHTVPQQKMSEETDIYPENYNGGHFQIPYKEVRVYSPVRKINDCRPKFNETDDSSWFDLTDCSTNMAPGFCSGDTNVGGRMYNQDEIIRIQELYEKKISELVNLIRDLKEENFNLTKNMEKCEIELSSFVSLL
ncbi:hypothetical protein MML48_8g00021542 [Holotrichia oblita]|uniref:Uncharacterized protein n=1 Tax=Holotrichia oblita TaxID=644536 RepID=A0ACB9SME6_HOLOL|nr:hypothetical protein MML48_8g00021542 [Holotrichia oblita]